MGEKRTGGVVVGIGKVGDAKVAVTENYGVGGKVLGGGAEGVADVGVICAVDPIGLGDLFAGDVALVIGIGFGVVRNACVNVGKSGDAQPAHNVVVGVECFGNFVKAGGNNKGFGAFGIGLAVNGGRNFNSAAGGGRAGVRLFAAVVSSRLQG